MNIVKINSRSQFLNRLSTSGKKYAIGKFFRDGCKPCKTFQENYIKPREHIEIDLLEINHNENKFISKQFVVKVLPTAVLFENGEPIKRMEGLKQADEFFATVDNIISKQRTQDILSDWHEYQ